MTDCFKQNLEGLADQYPELYEKVKLRGSSQLSVDCVNSAYVDLKYNELLAMLKNPAVVLWLGIFDVDVLVKYLKCPHENQRVVVLVERELDVFRKLLAKLNISDLIRSKKLFLCVDIAEDMFLKEIQCLLSEFDAFGMSRSYNACSSDNKFNEYYEKFTTIFETELSESVVITRTQPIDTFYGLVNIFENRSIFEGMPILDKMEGSFKGVPGVIVSTGPSLKRRIELLKRIKGKAVIFAADSALPILLAEGFVPNFVGVVERIPEVAHYFSEIDQIENMYLLTNPIVYPGVVRSYRGKQLCAMRDLGPLDVFYPKTKKMLSGSSVAHQGIGFLYFLGCSPIILIGQDLAFGEDGKSHAEGMLFQSTFSDDLNVIEEYWAKGNSGRLVRSLSSWRMFSKIISSFAYNYNVKFINVMESDVGAMIDGVTRCEPEGFDLPDLKFCIEQKISNYVNNLDVASLKIDTVLQVKDELIFFAEQCSMVFDALCVYIRGVNFSRQGLDEQNVDDFLNKIQLATQALQDDPIYALLGGYVQPKMAELSRESYELFGKDIPESEKLKRRFDYLADWLGYAEFWASLLGRYIDKRLKAGDLDD